MSVVLVSGAGGFVGLPLITQVAGSGHEVHALTTNSARAPQDGVRWHTVDLFDAPRVERLIDQLAPERLVHLAWCTAHGRFWSDPENVLWVERSLGLLRAFARCGGRRAVLLGTCAEYDWSAAATATSLSELHSAIVPATLYGVAKDALRRLACAYAHEQGVELAWARLFLLYGPRESPARLVPSLIRSLLARRALTIGDGARVRDLMHVDDVAAALAALLDSSLVGPVNVASGVGVTIGAVVNEITQLVGGAELVRSGSSAELAGAGSSADLPRAVSSAEPADAASSAEPRALVADVSRLRDELGFRPRWSLADGLAATVEWWREHERALLDQAAV